MRQLIVNTFLTLDGVMQAPGGPEEDPTGGFDQGGWAAGYWDDAMGARMGEFMGKPFDLLLGRKTYEIFAAHWPYQPEEDLGTKALNGARKYVASRTLKKLSWQNSTVLEGDLAQAVKKLKDASGPEIQVHGSGNLIQTLARADLVDRYQVWLFPLLVGRGKRLFEEGIAPAGLKLVESKTFGTGVVMAAYERDGDIKRGSFASEAPSAAELERRRKLR